MATSNVGGVLLLCFHAAAAANTGARGGGLSPLDARSSATEAEDAASIRSMLGAGLYTALLQFHASPSAQGDQRSKLVASAAALASRVAHLDAIEQARYRVAAASAGHAHTAASAPLPIGMDPKQCYGMKPCMHTTTAERIA